MPAAIDWIGKRFGKLTVVRYTDPDVVNGVSIKKVVCSCDCGGETISRVGNLGRSVNSCGCLHKEFAKEHMKNVGKLHGGHNKLPDKEVIAKDIYRRYVKSAKKRGYIFDILYNDFLSVIKLPCNYCGVVAGNDTMGFVYNGLDRRDNSIGYSLDNVVPCCGVCNRMKHTMSESDFLTHIANISNFKELK